MMRTTLLTSFLAMLAMPVSAADITKTASPNGRLVVTTAEDGGKITYSATYDGITVIEPSRLGLVANFGSLAEGLRVDSLYEGSVTYDYELPNIKVSDIKREGRVQSFYVSNSAGQRLGVEIVVEDNAIAIRYLIPKQGETGSIRVMSEATEFRFPSSTTTFLTPQSDAMIGWKRTKPSYEEEYQLDAPMTAKSKFGKGYTFPCLFKVDGGKAWALVSETGVTSKYCGSRLSEYENGAYQVAYPMPEENNGNGTVEPAMALPGETPWRTIAIGESPMVTAEQTITWDVVTPQYAIAKAPEYGKGTWSWILWQDASINYEDQKAYVDFAKAMGYSYVLIDNWWDLNIGTKGIENLVEYAKKQGVDIVLWYSSSGYWNDIVQGPINMMDRSIVRKQKMRWMKRIGVKGIKVDFFAGDKQETMRLYEDILSDAADNNLFVIFHGTTIPRGWERMYPNYVGSEAVLASENLIFEQHFCDTEAMCATLHPFIRNAVGCMEYGGSFLNRYMSRDNKSGNRRLTSQVFSLATAVAFQNPMQFFALAPNNLTDAPAECIDFLKEVPTTWDETRIIDGYPGKYVVLARRSGDDWYLAAINGTPDVLKVEVALPFAPDSEVKLYADGKTVDDVVLSTVKNGAKLGKLTIKPQGAVVMVGK
ncbi:MAG: glycoside hydrolase family 97 catalytic domain-containing protein [Bacteroidales bacterium]|nr:glycoside hydrolase family 97 catalytic domain-containing protein [Bacteroidales bacterium]